MKVVIIGSGKVGSNISNALSKEGHDVTVIDTNKTALEKIQDVQDVMCIEGDGADLNVLKEADVGKSGLFIATTPHDELNLLCCLFAKKLGAGRTMSRVRNPMYFSQVDMLKEDVGLSMVINPELITSDEIMRILVFPSAAKLEVFSRGRIELVEHRLSENSELDGMTLAEIYKKHKIKYLIGAVERDSQIFIPGGDFILHSGDIINIAASHRNLEGFFKAIGSMRTKIRTVMIVGGGKVCSYLVRQLLAAHMTVKVIEIDREKCNELAVAFPKANIIHADGTDQEVLVEQGIKHADAFISMTGIDEENIIMSLFAIKNSNAKVITKINRESYREIAGQVGLDCLISPKLQTESVVLSYVRSMKNTSGSNIEALYHLVDNKAEAIEFRIKRHIEGIVGIPLRNINLKKNILICGIIRRRSVIIPNGDDVIETDDSVIIISKDHHFSDITDILEE
ncbi:MAG: Trk system potassium transporter TrkA [Oscillospiraceae bacterium]|nr:Trk system potassium transporter TrkA [Oscillospiraceae bacterium]